MALLVSGKPPQVVLTIVTKLRRLLLLPVRMAQFIGHRETMAHGRHSRNVFRIVAVLPPPAVQVGSCLRLTSGIRWFLV